MSPKKNAGKKRLSLKEWATDARFWLGLCVLAAGTPAVLASTIDDIRWWPWRSEHLKLAGDLAEFETAAAADFKKRDLDLLTIRLNAAKRERRQLRFERRKLGSTPEIAEDIQDNKETIERLILKIRYLETGK